MFILRNYILEVWRQRLTMLWQICRKYPRMRFSNIALNQSITKTTVYKLYRASNNLLSVHRCISHHSVWWRLGHCGTVHAQCQWRIKQNLSTFVEHNFRPSLSGNTSCLSIIHFVSVFIILDGLSHCVALASVQRQNLNWVVDYIIYFDFSVLYRLYLFNDKSAKSDLTNIVEIYVHFYFITVIFRYSQHSRLKGNEHLRWTSISSFFQRNLSD